MNRRQMQKARRTLKDLGEFLTETATEIEERGSLSGFDDLPDDEYDELMDDFNRLDRAHAKMAVWYEDEE